MFADEKVIGEGGYGIVYHGVLEGGVQVAVKNLLNNRGQAEREFKVEVEAIGRVRHKNLVRLLGYCAEGNQRMLVYEYVNNGNLEQWLHGDVGPVSPLTWDIRMKIILGTAKGLMYLHEGLEPKVVHRDVKSSNILLDKRWNAKLSDFGLAKLLGSERSYVTTRVMGTFGYVAPEYAGTGMLNETSDVYSFGILIMEIISGRVPVDYNRPPGEVNLVEWLKTMVSNRNSEGVLDPKMTEKPTSRALKKALLVALRCVDPEARKRPKIGHVIHMLEVDDFPYRDVSQSGMWIFMNLFLRVHYLIMMICIDFVHQNIIASQVIIMITLFCAHCLHLDYLSNIFSSSADVLIKYPYGNVGVARLQLKRDQSKHLQANRAIAVGTTRQKTHRKEESLSNGELKTET
ncbi:unnamed protein product [Urochloa decumbens]|uniref:non-specific serine/threonine protein kinase n=1 Tax=Urochloa decumbens TaxID=240449 RepID=A0ABC9CXI6_9POAL